MIGSALHHPMASIRNMAAGLLPKVASAEEIERELPQLSQDCRRKLLRTVALMNRQELAERLLPVVQARWGPEEAAIVLQACSAATVRARLVELGYAIKDWKKSWPAAIWRWSLSASPESWKQPRLGPRGWSGRASPPRWSSCPITSLTWCWPMQ
ncbi:hypothetical protein ACFSQ7_46070 [Paenibacillus rhizoplanae]